MPGQLDKEIAYYASIKDKLLSGHQYEFALIRGDELVEVYKTEIDAITAGHRRYGNTPFLAIHIDPMEKPLFINNWLCV